MILLSAFIAAGLITSPSYQIDTSSSFYNHLTPVQQIFVQANLNSITQSDELLYNFKDPNNGDNSSSIDESEFPTWLANTYSEYTWSKTSFKNISTISGGVPVNIKGADEYTLDELEDALESIGVYSDYGGCGPNAMIGVLDFFARYKGYNEIISDPTNSDDRVQLATEVFAEVPTFEIDANNKLTFPWDYANSFNNLISSYDLTNYISARYSFKLFAGQQSSYWNTIKSNIDQGLPVTLATGLFSGDGDFAKHYTNIIGYETWIGTNGNETIQKDFILAVMNQNYLNAPCYCNADILNDGMVGIITYNCKNTSKFGAVDFAEEFVNSQGGGQYFNIEKAAPVTFLSNEHIQTYRLRTSYIENQYLVMSPNRANCGSAYLEMIFNHPVSVMTFDISLWGPNENITGQSLYTYYYDGSDWLMDQPIELSNLSTNKASPNRMQFNFPSDTVGVKFYTWHTNPSGDYNRGRICLDNFVIRY